MSSIPVIDVSGIGTDPGIDADLGREFLSAYGTWGFGYLIGHPIDHTLIDAVFEQSRTFHAQPSTAKNKILVNKQHRGFIPFKGSTDVNSSVETVTKPNQSESLMLLRDLPADHPEVLAGNYLAGANQWPSDLPNFVNVMTQYQQEMWKFSGQLIDVIARALNDDGSMHEAFESPTTWLRLLHYPPQDPQSPSDEFGSAPHTDFGAITLLAQDDVGGLSVKTPEGEWVDVPPMPHAFVMNVGDMLHRWSNGRLLSTPHRVTNRSGLERYSVPFFFDPNVTTVIEPLPSCVDSVHPPLFTPLTFGDFLRNELESSYDNHKSDAS
jgi:isopenicillin N synthase-like dioxygenase